MDPSTPITPSEPTPPKEQTNTPETVNANPTPAEPIVFSPTTPSATSAAPSTPTSPNPSATPSYESPAPVAGQPVINGTAGTVPPAGYNAISNNRKPRWLLPAVVLAALVVLAGGFVFGYYLPNQPSAVFNKSLKNSGEAVDKLINFSRDQTTNKFSTVNFDGNFNLQSSGLSSDVTLSGVVDKNGSGNLKLAADVSGEKINAEMRSIKKTGNDSPDLYVQVSGIKSALDANGLNAYDNLDGQWISIDHTLIDTYKNSIKSAAGSATTTMPTTAQTLDVITKLQTVNKQYLFSADKDKAVLVNEKFIAQEKMDGRTVNHYQTGYNKAHLEAYAQALKSVVESSSLPSATKKTYADAFDGMISSVKNSKADYSFDLYADTSSKLVHAVTFTDTADKSSKITFSQNYTGGDDYPFALAVESKTNGKAQTGRVDFTFNPITSKYKLTFKVDASGVTANGTLNSTTSNAAVTTVAPTSSRSINDVLKQLGLGNLNNPTALSGATGASSSPFTLTQ